MSTTTTGEEESLPPPPPEGPPPAGESQSWSEDTADSSSDGEQGVQQKQQQQQPFLSRRQYDSPAYVSSASSNSSAQQQAKAFFGGNSPFMRHSKSSSDDFALPMTTQQHAFPAFYDSDGSDGSLVFSYPRGTTPPATYDLANSMRFSSGVSPTSAQQQQQQQQQQYHERWGSMDSMGSTQSLVLVKKRPPPPHLQQQQQRYAGNAAVPSPHSSNYTPQNLPYHQRRKLLQQQRQQQQLQLQEQQQPVQQEEPAVGDAAYAAFQPQQQQPPPRRNSSGKGNSNFASSQSSTFHSKRPVPLDTISAAHPPLTPKTFSHHAIAHQQAMPVHPPPSPPHYSLPPSGHSRSFSGSGSFVPRGRLSSMDSQTSSDSMEQQRRQSRGGRGPPPPPPPLPPYSHVRADSSGSVSSLGSASDPPQPPPPQQQQLSSSRGGMSLTDRLDKDIAGFLQEEKHHGHTLPKPPPPPPPQQLEHRRLSGGSGFLLGLFNMSPQQSRQPNVEDYHQRNQAFLQKAERERAKLQARSSSLQLPAKKRGSTSPRPPNTRGVHRPGLSSIDNDNWEEDEHDDNKGRTQKKSRASSGYGHAAAAASSRNPPPMPFQEEEEEEEEMELPPHSRSSKYSSRNQDAARAAAIMDQHERYQRNNSFISSSQEDDDDESDDEASSSQRSDEAANERTSLLPPSGISTQEGQSKTAAASTMYTENRKSSSESRRNSSSDSRRSSSDNRRSSSDNRRSSSDNRRSSSDNRRSEWNREETVRWDNRQASLMAKKSKSRGKHHRKKGKKDRHHRSRRHRHFSPEESDEVSEDLSYISSSSSEYDYKRWAKKRAKMFEKERTKLIAQWKAEAKAEAEQARQIAEANRWNNRLKRWLENESTNIVDRGLKFLATAETFICNLPLTIGAVALAIVTLGVVWFKFAEENLDSCQPVHFHSSQCTFPEFPGCFYCDTHTRLYKVALNFHFCCSALAGILAMCFVAKVILAFRVVLDEMSSPTTSSPAGLICMTTVCVFAGRGWLGQILVSAAATLHLGLVIWFIYMALAYHIMPEPSWFPNTVGIGLSAVKTWLYYPMPGHFLMAISLSLNFFFFPISLIRVTLNKKISAPVCWIQMSAPAVSLYALTIMAQPSFVEEHPDVTSFQRVHRMIYLPCMHFLFVLAILGLLSSVQSLSTRWEKFKNKEFSPAHAAFCFPTLAHANAIQAYRAAVDAFSPISARSPFKIMLYSYWVLVLSGGTLATLYVTARFFYHLPSWTQPDVANEEEPPAPNETTLRDVIATGETLRQPFVSPAVLQANETGALVLLRRGDQDGRGRYVRTRRLPALGFEPTMNWSEMNAERDVLLDWVAKNPPRRRKKTLSVPGIDFNYGLGDFGTGNTGVYGLESGARRERSNTFDNFNSMRGGFY